jgi:hypothetical protein
MYVCPLISTFVFSGSATIMLYTNKTEFSTPLHKSYHCAKEQTFELMESGSNKTGGAVILSQVQLEAFLEKADNSFDTGLYCIRHVKGCTV